VPAAFAATPADFYGGSVMQFALLAAPQLREDVIPQQLARLAPWIHQASNPFADWYFGDPEVALEVITEWMARPSSELHLGRAQFLFGDDADDPLGVLIGMRGDTLATCRAADFVAFCEELGGGAEAEDVIEQVLPVARELFSPVAHDAFYISRVVVDPARRGAGLGRALVEKTLESQRAAGTRRFRLDVSCDNHAALRIYHALGFRVVSTAEVAEHGLVYHAMERE
jgi:ribosomal protein S18 acetylase RimI-like enzyme